MSHIQWTQELSVGDAAVDEEHLRLIALVNELYERVSSGESTGALAGVLSALVDATHAHFAHEDEEMRQVAYPGMNEHRLEHARLTQQVLELQRRVANGEALVLTSDALTFLRSWLTRHIQQRDAALTAYVRRQRAPQVA